MEKVLRTKQFIVLAAVVLMLAALPAAAQETGETLPFNYCAATLSYDLPAGWKTGNAFQYWEAVASLSSDQAYIRIEVLPRLLVANWLTIDPATDLDKLLDREIAHFSPIQITRQGIALIGDHRSAAIEFVSDKSEYYAIAADVGADAVAFIYLTAEDGITDQEKRDAEAIVGSLVYAVPPYANESSAVLLRGAYADAVCAVAFAYPQDWYIDPSHLGGSNGRFLDARISTDYQRYLRHDTLAAGTVHIRFSLWKADQDRPAADYVAQVQLQSGFDVISQQATTINGYPAFELQLGGDDEALAFLIDYGDRGYAALTLNTAPGELDQWRATAVAVAESIWIRQPAQ